jgi:hypothetical protein
MRVEPTAAEIRGDDNETEPPRGRGKRFRKALRQSRRTADATVVSPMLFVHAGTGHRAAMVQHQQGGQGSAPPRGAERVDRAESASLAAPRVDGLRAIIATPVHGAVDLSVRHVADGALIALAAAPTLAARLSATSGTLGRRLSVRDVRARSIRVTSSTTGTSSRGGGAKR